MCKLYCLVSLTASVHVHHTKYVSFQSIKGKYINGDVHAKTVYIWCLFLDTDIDSKLTYQLTINIISQVYKHVIIKTICIGLKAVSLSNMSNRNTIIEVIMELPIAGLISLQFAERQSNIDCGIVLAFKLAIFQFFSIDCPWLKNLKWTESVCLHLEGVAFWFVTV